MYNENKNMYYIPQNAFAHAFSQIKFCGTYRPSIGSAVCLATRNRISTCLKCPALPEMLKGALEKLPEEMPNYDTFGGPDSIALPHVSRNCLWTPSDKK